MIAMVHVDKIEYLFISVVSNGTAGGKDEEKEKLNKSSEEKESLAPPVLLDIDLVLEKVGTFTL